MNKNRVWIAFIATMALIVLWFTGMVGHQWYEYVTQNLKTPSLDVQWTVKEQSGDRYFLHASYRYKVKGKIYEGKTDFTDTLLRSPEKAQKMIANNSQKQWTVWYASSHDPRKSTILKNYPLKLTVYTVVLWGIMIYFAWLGVFVKKL